MTQPKARCVQCLEIIWEHDPHSNQRPKFCKNSQCRFDWKQNPICCRIGCRGPMPEYKTGQRYHEDCALGCFYCGGELFLRPSTSRRPNSTLQNIYCSKSCRTAAWEGQPMPNCLICGEPTDFGQTVLRNPPAMHHHCRPDNSLGKRRRYREKMDDDHDFWMSYRRHSRPPLVVYPDGLERPFDPFSEIPREEHSAYCMNWPQWPDDHIPAWCEVLEVGWERE